MAQLTGQAAHALEHLNAALVEFGGLPFCTMACVQLGGDVDDGKVEIMSAGHPLPYVIGADGAVSAGQTGPLLGFDPDARWSGRSVSLDPGEAIVLFSDGVTDTVGPGRERFGDERLACLLAEHSRAGASELVQHLDRELLAFQESEQTDDIAVLVLRRVG